MSQQPEEPYLGYYPNAELVLGIVCPLGTAYRRVIETLENILSQFKYGVNVIQLSDLFEDLLTQLEIAVDEPGLDRIRQAKFKIQAGNTIRERTGRNNVLALVAAGMIADRRIEASGGPEQRDTDDWESEPLHRTVHVIATLKRPEEVETLRRIYGAGFFLVGIASSKESRERYLEERGMGAAAADLIETDANEGVPFGQQTRETFYLADVFVSIDHYEQEIPRFLDLLFGCPWITPSQEEQSMFMAYSASLRSGDLSRQVGAAIIDEYGDLVSVGCNEVPKVGGGLYGPEAGNKRDITLGEDSNEIEKREMAGRILKALGREQDFDRLRALFKSTGFLDITEFGRPVHAEMEAILACVRSGKSTRGAHLYTTTFPCHNCCRHIIGAGIRRVVYIEPYAKSKASMLHRDEISIDREEDGKLPFLPFVGIGPRRYFDLFSLTLSSGYAVERKQEGKLRSWLRSATTAPRLQLQPSSYLNREILAWKSLKALLSKEETGRS